MSANEPLLHFGLGEETSISRLRIIWPSGTDVTLTNLPADRAYTIAEPSSAPSKKAQLTTTMTLFETRNCPTRARHREVPYDDFAREPLLPWKLSQLGPGLAMSTAMAWMISISPARRARWVNSSFRKRTVVFTWL